MTPVQIAAKAELSEARAVYWDLLREGSNAGLSSHRHQELRAMSNRALARVRVARARYDAAFQTVDNKTSDEECPNGYH